MRKLIKAQNRIIPIIVILIIAAVWGVGLFSRQITWADLTDLDNDREVYLMPSAHVTKEEQEYGVITRGPYLRLPAGKYRLQWRIWGDGDNRLSVTSANHVPIEPKEFILPKEETNGSFIFSILEPAEGFEVHISFENGTEMEVEDLRLYSPFYKDNAFTVSFFGGMIILLWIYFSKGGTKENLTPFALIAVAVIFSSALSLKDSVIIGHDTPFHWERLYNLADGIRNGQFPVRCAGISNNGYGAITSVFYPDLFLYPGAIMLILGASGTYVFNIYLIFLNALSAVCMFYCAKCIFKDKWTACMAACLYVTAPYHFTDVYIRHALGEAAAMAVLPVFFLGIWEVIFGDQRKWPWLSLGAFLVYSSHILSTAMCAGMSFCVSLFYFFKIVREKRVMALFKAILLATGLCMWHLLPLIIYMSEGIGASSLLNDVSRFSLDVAALFLWRFGDKSSLTETSMNGMPVEPGLVLWMGLFLLLYFYLMYGDIQREVIRIVCMGLVSVFLTLKIFPWNRVAALTGNKVNYLQFAWRFMTLGTFFLSLVAAQGYRKLKPDSTEVPLAVLFLSVLLLMPSVTEKSESKKIIELGEAIFPEHYYEEYTLPGTDMNTLRERRVLIEDGLNVTNYSKIGTTVTADIIGSSRNAKLTIPLFAFSGYRAEINGKEIPYEPGENGCICLSIPAEVTGKLRVWFKGKLIWRVGDIISILSLIVLAFILLCQKYQNKHMNSRPIKNTIVKDTGYMID